jgi:hypothetical protein
VTCLPHISLLMTSTMKYFTCMTMVSSAKNQIGLYSTASVWMYVHTHVHVLGTLRANFSKKISLWVKEEVKEIFQFQRGQSSYIYMTCAHCAAQSQSYSHT